MQVFIDKLTNYVEIDGFGLYGLDLSSLPAEVEVVRWGVSGGIVDFGGRNSKAIDSVEAYQPIIDAFNAARSSQLVPPAPPVPEPVPDSVQVQDKLNAVRVVREAMLNRMTGIALAAQLTGDAVTVSGYLVARQGLLNITQDCPTDPAQVDAFILQKYAAIRSQVPPSLISAFAGVDA